ncbi:MAG: transposase [Spirochaetaceae bacterium]|jgi:REP element-mobilizing transposase RayT|nr:transposase [Spirochaetaceae bacterium]
MRPLRILKQGAWYEIRTRINNREPVFRLHRALELVARVFRETKRRFVFDIRGLCLEDDWLTFYIRPADGLELPAIMKWLKQVFAQRYNRVEGRIGHIWGDRYGSRIVEGDTAEEEVTTVGERSGASNAGVRPLPPCLNKPRQSALDSELIPISTPAENSPGKGLYPNIGVRPSYGEPAIPAVFSSISAGNSPEKGLYPNIGVRPSSGEPAIPAAFPPIFPHLLAPAPE